MHTTNNQERLTAVHAGTLEDLAVSLFLGLEPGFVEAFVANDRTIGLEVKELVEQTLLRKYPASALSRLESYTQIVLDKLFQITKLDNRDSEDYDHTLDHMILDIRTQYFDALGNPY